MLDINRLPDPEGLKHCSPDNISNGVFNYLTKVEKEFSISWLGTKGGYNKKQIMSEIKKSERELGFEAFRQDPQKLRRYIWSKLAYNCLYL